jgi:hypothetical protein
MRGGNLKRPRAPPRRSSSGAAALSCTQLLGAGAASARFVSRARRNSRKPGESATRHARKKISRFPAATDAPGSRDRTSDNPPRRTRQSLPDPTFRSAPDKKRALELPPDRGDTKVPSCRCRCLRVPIAMTHSKLRNPRRRVIS